MSKDTPAPKGETEKTPSSNASADLEKKLEEAKKENEKLQMRINQLENSESALKEELEKTKEVVSSEESELQKVIRQQEERIKELQKQVESIEVREQLIAKQKEILKEFDPKVKTLAKRLGLELKGVSDEEVEQFKQRLEEIDKEISELVNANNSGDKKSKQPKTEEEQLAEMEDKLADVVI